MTETRVENLRRRLRFVAERTQTVSGRRDRHSYWDTPANRLWFREESGRGRLAWRGAYQHAIAGLAACEEGDLEFADTLAWSAMEAYARGLEQQVQWVRPEDRETLAKPAKRRGRPPGSKTGAKKNRPSENIK